MICTTAAIAFAKKSLAACSLHCDSFMTWDDSIAYATGNHTVPYGAVQLQGSNIVKMQYALQSVAPAATQLQQLRLLTEKKTYDELLGTDAPPSCFDIGNLVGQGPRPFTLCICCSPPLQVKRVWLLCCGDMLLTHWSTSLQACISQMRSLTRLEASYIGTPLEPPTLDDLLGSLPTLQHLCLHFAAAGSSVQDLNISLRVRPVDFP